MLTNREMQPRVRFSKPPLLPQWIAEVCHLAIAATQSQSPRTMPGDIKARTLLLKPGRVRSLRADKTKPIYIVFSQSRKPWCPDFGAEPWKSSKRTQR